MLFAQMLAAFICIIAPPNKFPIICNSSISKQTLIIIDRILILLRQDLLLLNDKSIFVLPMNNINNQQLKLMYQNFLLNNTKIICCTNDIKNFWFCLYFIDHLIFTIKIITNHFTYYTWEI